MPDCGNLANLLETTAIKVSLWTIDMKQLFLAVTLIAQPAYAQVEQSSDEYKRIEYKVRLEHGSEKSSYFILQDKVADSEERCGWIWSTQPYPNVGWKLFRYYKIGNYEGVSIYHEDPSYRTLNYVIIMSCYSKGYIPSLIPLGKYQKQWDAMRPFGKLDNYGF
jgi:hypothetical protein